MLSLNDLVTRGEIPPEAAEELRKMAESSASAGLAVELAEVKGQLEGLQAALCEKGTIDIGDVPESSRERVGQIAAERSAAGTLPGDGKLNRT